MLNIPRLLGQRCFLCLQPCNLALCSVCMSALPIIETPCPVCGLPLDDGGAYCGDCLKQDKPYTLTLSPLIYGFPTRGLIQAFKNGRPKLLGDCLTAPLIDRIHQCYETETLPQLLVPVPCHWTTLLRRGYNQAHYLGDILARSLNVPCRAEVKRHHTTAKQKNLTRAQRLYNLENVFYCPQTLSIDHVAVIDDVITSCATAIAMSHALFAAGAKRVDVWATARTLPRSN